MLALVADTVPLLRTRRFGRPMEGFARVGSTNTTALQRALQGAPEGTVIAADYQESGRGRMGRNWVAQPGLNLTFSVVLRPHLPLDRLGLITLGAGVAVADAVEALSAPMRPTIKWPNDVLLSGRKCCGMLLESNLPVSPEALPVVILGIGLNVNQVEFPPEIERRATSLALETGRFTSRPPLLADLLFRLEQLYDTLGEDGGAVIRRRYVQRLTGLGAPITLHLPGTDASLHGILRGITETGALRLETENEERIFNAGEVSTAAPIG